MVALFRISIISIGVGLCLFLGCERKPVEPKQPVVESYSVYLACDLINSNDNYLYKFNTKSRLRDSVKLTRRTATWPRLAVSGFGDRAYSAADNSIDIIDTKRMEIIGSYPYAADHVIISHDSRILAVAIRDSLFFLDATSGLQLHVVPRNSFRGSFSSDDQWFYSWIQYPDVTIPIEILRVNTSSWTETYHFKGVGSYTTTYDPVEKKWFLYRSIAEDIDFLVVADTAEQVLFSTVISPGVGDFVYHSESRKLYFTNPGTLILGTPPRPFLYWLDVRTLTLDSIAVNSLTNSGYRPQFIAQDISMSVNDSLICYGDLRLDRILLLRTSDQKIIDTILMGPGAAEVSSPFVVPHYSN